MQRFVYLETVNFVKISIIGCLLGVQLLRQRQLFPEVQSRAEEEAEVKDQGNTS